MADLKIFNKPLAGSIVFAMASAFIAIFLGVLLPMPFPPGFSGVELFGWLFIIIRTGFILGASASALFFTACAIGLWAYRRDKARRARIERLLNNVAGQALIRFIHLSLLFAAVAALLALWVFSEAFFRSQLDFYELVLFAVVLIILFVIGRLLFFSAFSGDRVRGLLTQSYDNVCDKCGRGYTSDGDKFSTKRVSRFKSQTNVTGMCPYCGTKNTYIAGEEWVIDPAGMFRALVFLLIGVYGVFELSQVEFASVPFFIAVVMVLFGFGAFGVFFLSIMETMQQNVQKK